MKLIFVSKMKLQTALFAARLKNYTIWALNVTFNQPFLWTDSTTVLQWINSTEKQSDFDANHFRKILEYTSVDQWNLVATKNYEIQVFRSCWSKRSSKKSNLLSAKRLLLKKLYLWLHLLKNRQLQFRLYFVSISLVLINITCVLHRTFSDFYLSMPVIVILLVVLLTALNLKKPSVICSTWRKESLLKPKKRIFLKKSFLNGVAELLRIRCFLVQQKCSWNTEPEVWVVCKCCCPLKAHTRNESEKCNLY